MTTKLKARKFRIRRSSSASAETTDHALEIETAEAAAAGRRATAARPEAANAAHAEAPRRRAIAGETPAAPRSGAVSSAAEVQGETDIQAIRAEGLTGRQLRMARRVAQKHGLAPTSDFDAVRLLRLKGIDPFQRINTLELVVTRNDDGTESAAAPAPEARAKAPAEQDAPGRPARKDDARVQLPQTMQFKKQQVPSTEVDPGPSPAERRAQEISRMQRDLARRRRRKMALLVTRLFFFIAVPTALAGHYFFNVATPLYSTKSQFLILAADGGGGGGVGGLFSGTQFATNQDAIAVQSYLASKDAMLRLDRDEGFKTHFSQDFIDPLQRLDETASNEEAYDVYQRNVEIGYDPTEGVVKMEVTAADPEVAAEFSRALISYAEERVDNLSQRKRSNAVIDAEAALEEAQVARRDAQETLVRLQQESSLLDPEGRIAALRSQMNTFEVQLREKRLQLQALLDNARPNQSRVDGAEGDIRRLEAVLAELNTQMTTAQEGETSLADVAVQVQLAEADLATRDMMLSSALERLETARRDADSQARYLTTSVVPVASEDPSYPRAFENTLLALLIFSGIYLMVSLTASILREQVSA
ncbi:capsule polysaccharide export protein [Roseivivax marinus]|uniref:Capsule polysaccharide export protein n=1 Tax=Roseivivax marinus TaxID=1379903 RepID=W4HI13_9RHOB|nr:capsule biosynthesis protein [Roseivivax marinus]ETW12362.1 capsule polysaccharide export protein [Roseivivax marinus]UMA64308.1 capsule biosynthesis protein [Roseivivax marinus]